MANEIQIIDPQQYPGWDELVRESENPSLFHTSMWCRVLRESYGYKPCYFVLIDGSRLSFSLPLIEIRSILTGARGVSLPFTDYCEPIVSAGIRWQGIFDQVKDFGKRSGWKYIELRGGHHALGPVPVSSSYYSHVMQLTTDIGALLSRLKSRNRRNIKKAQREGIQVSRHDSPDAVDAFYRIHCMTRKKHGVPPQPRAFFNNIYRHVIARNHGAVFLASYQGTPIAGAVYLHFGKEAIYKFGASCEKYLPLRPNDLVMWEAIQWYARQRYSKFSLGRTDVDNEGLRAFKTGWGAQEEMLGYFTYDIGKQQFLAAKRPSTAYSQAIFKRVPIGLSRLVGKALYRHVG